MFSILIASGKMKQPRPIAGVLASLLLHGSVVTAALLAGRPAIRAATDFEQRIAAFLFPKDRAPTISDESLVYMRVPGGGSGVFAAIGEKGAGAGRDATKPRDPNELQLVRPDPGKSAAPIPEEDQVKVAESLGAFAMLDVDSAAARDPNSAAPAYPFDMESAGIGGAVRARFVVDSTGLIDLSTVKILEKTNDSFARAVRAAMPEMRFRPAKMGPTVVRQLSEQEFRFAIQVRHDSTVPPKKP